MATKRTHEQFIEELRRINPSVEIIGQYVSTNTKIKCRCRSCGNVWDTIPKVLLNGSACRKCSFIAMGKARRKSNEQFIEELRNVNRDIVPLEIYVNDSTKIECKCSVCGHIWKVLPNRILRGSGCPSCKGGIRKTNRVFLEEIEHLGLMITPLEEYVNAFTKIKFKCNVCNHVWEASPTSIVNKKCGCPECSRTEISKKRSIPHSDFKERMLSINPEIELIDEYINNHTKLKCSCLRCGHTWSVLPTNLVKGRGCPNCSHTSTSFVEQVILFSFIKVLGKEAVLSRDVSAIGMELDIYIPSLRLAIEPGNWFWHKDKVVRDTKKRELCAEKNIRLITVFDGFNGEPNLFQKDFYYTGVSLNDKKYYHILEKIIYQIFDEYAIITNFSSKEWETILLDALEASKKKTTEDFVREVQRISPQIEVLGEYQNNKTVIECMCKDCGWKWWPSPDKLLQKRKCPKCAGTMKKSHEQFCEELSKVNPKIKVLGRYMNSKTKIEVVCEICSNKWLGNPSTLLKGHGCPRCAIKMCQSKLIERNAKDNNLFERFPEVVKDWDYEKNKEVVIEGVSAGSVRRFHWKCHKCGFEYMSTPANRTKHGCPRCARVKTINASLRKVINIDTGEVFPSLKAAGEKYGGTSKGISNACAGRVKTAYGFHWAYYDNNGPRKRTIKEKT